MWKADAIREVVEKLAELPDRLVDAMERMRGRDGAPPSRAAGTAGGGGGDERQRLRLSAESARLMRESNLLFRGFNQNLRTSTRELGQFSAALHSATRVLANLRPGVSSTSGGPPAPPPLPSRTQAPTPRSPLGGAGATFAGTWLGNVMARRGERPAMLEPPTRHAPPPPPSGPSAAQRPFPTTPVPTPTTSRPVAPPPRHEITPPTPRPAELVPIHSRPGFGLSHFPATGAQTPRVPLRLDDLTPPSSRIRLRDLPQFSAVQPRIPEPPVRHRQPSMMAVPANLASMMQAPPFMVMPPSAGVPETPVTPEAPTPKARRQRGPRRPTAAQTGQMGGMVGEFDASLVPASLAEVRGLAGPAPTGAVQALTAGVQAPHGGAADLLAQTAQVLTQILERFSGASQQLQEILAVLHQRFPGQVPAASMPREGAVAPGSKPAKEPRGVQKDQESETSEATDTPRRPRVPRGIGASSQALDLSKLSSSLDKLADAVNSLRGRLGEQSGPAAVPAQQGVPLTFSMPRQAELVPVPLQRPMPPQTMSMAGPGGLSLPSTPVPPRPSASTPTPPPTPTAPPNEAARRAFLDRLGLKRLRGSPISAKDVGQLRGLIESDQPLQQQALAGLLERQGKLAPTHHLLDTLRHAWRVNAPQAGPELLRSVLGRLMSASTGRTAVTTDMVRDLALSGAEPNEPFPGIATLLKRWKQGGAPSRKLVAEFAKVHGLADLLPADWLKARRKRIPKPGDASFVGPVLPTDPSPTGPSEPAEPAVPTTPPAPPPSPQLVKLLDELRARAGKRTISQDFLKQAREALSGRAGGAELLAKLEAAKGKTLGKKLASEVARAAGFNLLDLPPPTASGEGVELSSTFLPGLTPATMRSLFGVLRGGMRLPSLRNVFGSGGAGNLLGALLGGGGRAGGHGPIAINTHPALASGGASIAKRFLAASGHANVQRMPTGFGKPTPGGLPGMLTSLRGTTGAMSGVSLPASAGSAAAGLATVAAAAAAAGYALLKMPHDIARGARGQVESLRELSSIHGGMQATFIGADLRALQRDIKYADRITETTRGLAIASANLDDRLLEARSFWTNAKNLFWSGLSGYGSALADATSPAFSAANQAIGGQGATEGLFGAMYGFGRAGFPGAAIDKFFGWEGNAKLDKEFPDEPWSKFIVDMAETKGPLRPARPVR